MRAILTRAKSQAAQQVNNRPPDIPTVATLPVPVEEQRGVLPQGPGLSGDNNVHTQHPSCDSLSDRGERGCSEDAQMDVSSDSDSDNDSRPQQCNLTQAQSRRTRPRGYMLRRHLSDPVEIGDLLSEPAWELPWVKVIRTAMRPQMEKLIRKGMRRAMTLEIGCAGFTAELWVAAALGLPLGQCDVAESSTKLQAFTRRLFKSKCSHIFGNLSAFYMGGQCSLHGIHCSRTTDASRGSKTERKDGNGTGSPCDPFSRLSTTRSQPELHPAFNTTFGDADFEGGSWISCLRDPDTRPRGGWLENVWDITYTHKQGKFAYSSPLSQIKDMVESIIDESTGRQYYTATQVIKLDNATWVQCSRPRLL